MEYEYIQMNTDSLNVIASNIQRLDNTYLTGKLWRLHSIFLHPKFKISIEFEINSKNQV